MSGRDDRAPSVPDCFGCRWLVVVKHFGVIERKLITSHDCVRKRIEVPNRCDEYSVMATFPASLTGGLDDE